MSETTTPNPWPGLASYTEEERHLFFGRGAEINEMTRLVQRETLTVLFGRSGLGKSSLLRAGVMPRLREQGFFPVTLRLDFSERGEITPVEQVKALTLAAAKQAGVEAENVPENAAALTLWEWFHAVEFWGPRNDPVTPILALDQFEEVFTLGRNLGRTDEFIEQFADLVENRVPQSVRDRGERLAYDATQHGYKVILSLREDFVPRLDSLRPVLPAVMRNRFALAPLDSECAVTVVLGAGRTWISDADAQEIVAAVVGGDGPLVYRPDAEVEPAYLSVMCHELFRRMQALGRERITGDLIEAERGGILEGLYTRSFEGIGDPVRFFVEDRLLTPSGFRGTLPLADAAQEGVAESDLRTLVDRRLLRFEDRLGTIHMELSHDLLTRIVLKRRESRRAEAALRVETERAQKFRAAQLRQRRRSRIVAGVAVALAVLLVGTVWGGYYCFVQEHRTSYRDVLTRRGFPVGNGELSAAQASRLPLHYVVCYKGLTWDGWRPHWRPAFRFMAMDGRGNLTTNHGVGTFFWRAQAEASSTELNKDRGQALGLSSVCQWEFSADAEGGIAYARGLDRDGRMVWGCLYSPAASGSANVRIAHYVGPDGFPQLQNKSAAEYIEVHYDARGWEERILFLDAMARPAAGPDGEFGTTKQFDNRGNVTLITVLDEKGKPMVEHQGNAALRVTYNADGLLDEATALDAEGRVVATNDGWAKFKHHYDEFGRRKLIENFDAEGRPVLRKTNFSAVENTYDDRGGLVRETFLGVDGQPWPIVGSVIAIQHEIDAQGDETRTVYVDAAGRPSALVDGSCGSRSSYDARHNLVARTATGPDDQPYLNTEGYAGWRSEFDAASRETRRLHTGATGEPTLIKNGYHGYETTYDARGNAARFTYLGLDGKPASCNDGIAGWAAEFDARGRETRRTFFGPANEPVLHKDGYHAWTTSYDEHGYEAEFDYLDLNGKPVAVADRYAIQKIQHDVRGRETRRTYFDEADKPVDHKDGYHGWLYRHDARGNVIEATTINTNNLPAAPTSGGYAREVKTYDARGDLASRRFFDADGEAASNATGVYGVTSRHDSRGNVTEEIFEGEKPGEPMAAQNGVARNRIEYDAWSRQTRFATVGLQDEPVPGISGACAQVSHYDPRGNWTGSTWLDAEGKPTASKNIYATIRLQYDDRSRCTETAYFDPAGQPVAGSENNASWTKTYDDRGNAVRWNFLDGRGQLLVTTGGYAAIEWGYDDRGKKTRKTYLGADGKPLVQEAGYATVLHAYTPSGLDLSTDYLDAQGKPRLCNSGYCSVYNEYDDRGGLRAATWAGIPGLTSEVTTTTTYRDGLGRESRYFSADGKPVNCSLGYAWMKRDYDATGSLIRMEYQDAAGQPAYGILGFTKAEYVDKTLVYYDAAGKPMRDNDHSSTRPLLYVNFLRSADSAAARAGLQPGDLIWQLGDFSFPKEVAAVWKQHNTDDAARNVLNESWTAALGEAKGGPIHIAVLRQDRLIQFDLPEVPAGGVGMSLAFRRVPAFEYNGLVARHGMPGVELRGAAAAVGTR